MAVTFENNGEKTTEGFYVATVDAEDGSQAVTFKAATRKELSEKMAAANFEAMRSLNALKRDRKPETVRGSRAVTPMTADERMQAIQDIKDPASFDRVIARAVESSLGVPLDTARNILNENQRRTQDEREVNETKKFVAQNPDWYPTAENKGEMMARTEAQKLAITATNLGIVWEQMKAEGKADLKPEERQMEEEEEPPSQAQPATRQRAASYSTGVRSGEISTQRPAAKPRYTRAEIENMPSTLYREKLLHEPGFSAIVDKVMATA